ncbi:Dirigent protein [Dillenia turbinata]|uniref:Dirigent protein n=1 Tax=Dillenia turbinata TaxID=194707 RepID=A0AAN8USG2_9MAGN
MAKLEMCLVLFLSMWVAAVMPQVKGNDELLGMIRPRKEKVTRLHFYFHEKVSGQNPTSATVAQAPNMLQSPTFFGGINVVDDALTDGPDPTSKLVGRAQGMYASSGLSEITLLMAVDLVFTDNSTLSIFGQNHIHRPIRRMSIIGGTGAFELARGYLTFKTHYYNPTSGNAILECDIQSDLQRSEGFARSHATSNLEDPKAAALQASLDSNGGAQLETQFTNFSKDGLSLDENTFEEALKLFRDSKHLLLANVSSIGSGTPEEF